MRSGKPVMVVLTLGLLAVPALAQSPDDARQRIAQSILADAVSEATSSVEQFETNGFQVESSLVRELGTDLQPGGAPFQMMSVSAADMFRVAYASAMFRAALY